MKQDVYERITGRIVAELEQGARPWPKPWNAEAMPMAGAGPVQSLMANHSYPGLYQEVPGAVASRG